MMKRLLIFTSLLAFLMVAPQIAGAAGAWSYGIEQLGDDDDVTINVHQQTVFISGAQGKTLEVVSLTGRRVMTVKIESPSQRVELNIPKGCYILKVGKVVRKIIIH